MKTYVILLTGINVKDNNKSKDIAGRLTIRPIADLKIAAYYMGGETNATSLVTKYPTMVAAGTSTNLEYLDYNRYGGGFDYENKFLFARAEYLGGRTGDYLSSGLYALVGYKFLEKCSLGVRYSYFNENLNGESPTPVQTNYSVAFSYHPWKYLRVQAEYTRQNYEKLPAEFAASAAKKNENCLYFMVSAIF